MQGKKTDPRLVDEIRELRWVHRPAVIVRMMAGRLHRRTVYRILERLKREDEERRREDAERVRRALEREEAERIRLARLRGAKRFTSVAQLPANLGKVRAS
jgi:hypothetical protein